MKKYLALIVGLTMMLMISACPSDNGESNAKNCADLTKAGKLACIKKDAIKGKICVWDTNNCVENTATSQAIKDFKNEDRVFQLTTVDWDVLAKSQALGADHSEGFPTWNKMCGGGEDSGSFPQTLTSFTLSFKKNTDDVKVTLDCTKGGLGTKDYEFGYQAKALADGALQIVFDLKGLTLTGTLGQVSGVNNDKANSLEFFSKSNWLYSAKNNKIYGIYQHANFGSTQYAALPLLTEKEFDDAVAYARDTAKGNSSNIGKALDSSGKQADVAAVTLIFHKI